MAKKEVRLYKIDFHPDAGGGHTLVFTQDKACDLFEYGKDANLDLKCHGYVVFKGNMKDIICVADMTSHTAEDIKYGTWVDLEKEAAKGVYRSVGKAIDFGDRQAYLLPGNIRMFEINIPNLESGIYRTILAVNYKEETQPVVRYQRFIVK